MNKHTTFNRTTHFLSPLVLALLLPACGGGGGGEEPVDNNPPPAQNTVPIATAGLNQDITKSALVTLDGTASVDPDGDSLSYRWEQTHGPDVTGGTGVLSTEQNPGFNVPEEVSTLIFKLIVNDGTADSEADEVQINILEDTERAFFVDGDNGDDTTGDGTRQSPYKTLAHAVSQTTASGEDIYIMTRADDQAYPAFSATLQMKSGSSLYGGYDTNWIRDVATNRSKVAGKSTAIQYAAVNAPSWISGLDITAAESNDAAVSVMAVLVEQGDSTLTIENNTLTSSDVRPGTAPEPGSSYGVVIKDIHTVKIRANDITTGRGGEGNEGDKGAAGDTGERGEPGKDAVYDPNSYIFYPAKGGQNYSFAGDGGQGGFDPGVNGTDGGNGNCSHPNQGSTRGTGGAGGSGGSGNHGKDGNSATGKGNPGKPGAGADGSGTHANALFKSSTGGTGPGRGKNGCAGGGGGGGEASVWYSGGHGGGGGGGGLGGPGGFGGHGGGASIGIWLYHTQTNAEIEANTIVASDGGSGGLGGAGGDGGKGGIGGAKAYGGGRDANGTCNKSVTCGGNSGKGGNGADGGDGGQGGGGGGGPTYGIFVGPDLAPTITDNEISTGQGGWGGAGGNGGDGGWSYGIFAAKTDLNVPALLQNTITLGLGGAFGAGGAGTDGVEGRVGRLSWQ